MSAVDIEELVERLRRMGSEAARRGMARYGINVDRALGIPVTALRRMARDLPKDHDLASALWATGIHEARILASMVEQPERVTGRQMDRWVRDLDSWDLCDLCCGNVFWKTPLADDRSVRWAARRAEFVRRASFALMATAAAKDRGATEERFLRYLPVIEAASDDERNFVKKAVNWALRQIGKRNASLHGAAVDAARRIGRRSSRSARWIAADALRELEGDAVRARLELR